MSPVMNEIILAVGAVGILIETIALWYFRAQVALGSAHGLGNHHGRNPSRNALVSDRECHPELGNRNVTGNADRQK